MKNGARVFDVSVEKTKLTELDVFSEAGSNTALEKTFIVDADEYINIDLSRRVQNPAIKAIEVIATNGLSSNRTATPVVEHNVAANSESTAKEINPQLAETVKEPDPTFQSNTHSELQSNSKNSATTVQSQPSDHCIVYGDSLVEAKKVYQTRCSLPRVDCDPTEAGTWACSSTSI